MNWSVEYDSNNAPVRMRYRSAQPKRETEMSVTCDARTKRKALKARQKIDAMVREWKHWKGEAPTVVRVRMSDYLALTEVGWIKDGRLSGSTLEVKPG